MSIKKYITQKSLKKIFILPVTAAMLMVFFPAKSYCQIAKGASKFLGNIIENPVPPNFTEYWDQVTPENAGKWGRVEEKENVFYWAGLDSIYNFALKHGIKFKFHNLVWGKQQPDWIKNLDSAQQVMQVKKWIDLAGKRYPKADFVDVVNEPIRTAYDTKNPPYYKAIGGAGKTGWDWVIWSFEQARTAFPHSKLILNEFNILNGKKPIKTFIHIIDLLKERNLIDGIGCQGHFMEGTDSSTIRSNLNLLAKTGLPIYISEYDVNENSDAGQLKIIKEQFPVFWDSPYVKGITFWGYIQNRIWRKDAYLVRADGTERPALKWLKKFVSGSADGQ